MDSARVTLRWAFTLALGPFRLPWLRVTSPDTLRESRSSSRKHRHHHHHHSQQRHYPLAHRALYLLISLARAAHTPAHRATVLAGERGRYRFESNLPVSYGGRPPHIHVRVTAPGFEDLVTQHYPERGQRKANFDLVLGAE